MQQENLLHEGVIASEILLILLILSKKVFSLFLCLCFSLCLCASSAAGGSNRF
jgi:hypothetical protein